MTNQYGLIFKSNWVWTHAAQVSKMAEASGRHSPSGYDEDFVSEVEDDFQCLICHLPLKDAGTDSARNASRNTFDGAAYFIQT